MVFAVPDLDGVLHLRRDGGSIDDPMLPKPSDPYFSCLAFTFASDSSCVRSPSSSSEPWPEHRLGVPKPLMQNRQEIDDLGVAKDAVRATVQTSWTS